MAEPSVVPVICALGACLPPRSLTNHDVIVRGRLETTDQWITSRTGITRRRIADRNTSTGDLAVAAGRTALQSAPGSAPDILILATTTPDHPCPATAPEVAHRLGLGPIPAFDIAAVCSGFLYALDLASAMIRSGSYQHPLIIAAEKYSSIIDELDRDTAPLFGDGAAAVMLRPGSDTESGAVLKVSLASDGRERGLITVAAGGSRQPHGNGVPRDQRYFRMAGKQVYARAVHEMTEAARHVLREVGWTVGAVDAFVGHQANQRILDSVAARLGIDTGKCVSQIREVGNTAAASIPLAMADACARRAVRPGARTVITSFGGGLTWGAAALRWPEILVSPRTYDSGHAMSSTSTGGTGGTGAIGGGGIGVSRGEARREH